MSMHYRKEGEMNLHKTLTVTCGLSEHTELLNLAKHSKNLVQLQKPSNPVVSSSFSSPQTLAKWF